MESTPDLTVEFALSNELLISVTVKVPMKTILFIPFKILPHYTTPFDACPALALSVAIFFVNFVCSSASFSSILAVSFPEA